MTGKTRRTAAASALMALSLLFGAAVAGPVLAQAEMDFTEQEVADYQAATTRRAFVIVPECARATPANTIPQLSCVMEMFGNVATMILGVTGSFALLMFVYGGFLMVTSAGDSSKVSAGKKVLTNAVIGIFIIMVSGIALRYALGILVRNNNFRLVGQPCAGKTGQVYVLMPDGSIGCAAVSQ
ncbi:hypothetical protein JW899_00795 [Candidatus Uhrbacteria bacterium]|nr:hypothetical protein [Candidatus Uhrbacteria bacterium]